MRAISKQSRNPWEGRGTDEQNRPMASATEAPPPPAEERDWAELPWDALALILEKLGAIGVLLAAQHVCRPWRHLSYDPRVWRRVDMRVGMEEVSDVYDIEALTMAAVDRSSGSLVAFSAKDCVSDEVLLHISERNTELRSLRLVSSWTISKEVFVEVTKRFSSLEELEVTHCKFIDQAFESFDLSFPNLKCLQLNCTSFPFSHSECNNQALAIAMSMPQLRELQIFGNRIGNHGLLTILECCPLLESLDIRNCFSIWLNEALRNRCKGLKSLRFPMDCHADYPYDSWCLGSEYGSEYEDYVYDCIYGCEFDDDDDYYKNEN